MLGIIKYVCSMEIAVVARSLRSLLKMQPNLTTDPARSQMGTKPPPYRRTNASGIGFRLGYSFSSERSERATRKRASQTNLLARRYIEILEPARGAGSFYRISY